MAILISPRTESVPHAGAVRHHRKKRWLGVPIAAFLVAVAGSAAFAYAFNSSKSTVLECPTGIYDAVTGDPIADCSSEWRRATKTEPPPMVAYDNGNGGVTVLLAGDPIPESYSALPPGPFQDEALIRLQASLGDYGTGLSAGCYDETTARTITQAELNRLGLTDWKIVVDKEREFDGAATCGYFVINQLDHEVQLIGVSVESTSPDPYAKFAGDLDARLQAACLGIDEATEMTRAFAETVDIYINGAHIELNEDKGVLVINAAEDPSKACTTADVNVGGRVEVTLRGPSS